MWEPYQFLAARETGFQRKEYGAGKCEHCEEEFSKGHPKQVFCMKRDCRKALKLAEKKKASLRKK